MGRSIEVTNAGVYICINKEESEIFNYFGEDTDLSEWLESQYGFLYNQGEMPANIIFVSDGKYDLSDNIQSSDIETLYDAFTTEYKTVLDNLKLMFGANNVDVKVGIIEYFDEIA